MVHNLHWTWFFPQTICTCTFHAVTSQPPWLNQMPTWVLGGVPPPFDNDWVKLCVYLLFLKGDAGLEGQPGRPGDNGNPVCLLSFRCNVNNVFESYSKRLIGVFYSSLFKGPQGRRGDPGIKVMFELLLERQHCIWCFKLRCICRPYRGIVESIQF